MSAHTTFAALADAVDGLRALPVHAVECDDCSEIVAWLREGTALLAAGAAVEPPRAVLRRAFRIPTVARVRTAVDGAREWVATLVRSLGPDPALAPALRGAAATHAVYEAGPFDIEIEIEDGTLRGSVLPRDEEAAAPQGTVVFRRGRREAGRGALDDRGRFTIEVRGRGAGDLELALDDGLIRLPGLEI